MSPDYILEGRRVGVGGWEEAALQSISVAIALFGT